MVDSIVETAPEGAPPQGQELETDAVVEALLSKSLNHPHIVSTFDYGVSTQVRQGQHYMFKLVCSVTSKPLNHPRTVPTLN